MVELLLIGGYTASKKSGSRRGAEVAEKKGVK
jgi:hypothetical protein